MATITFSQTRLNAVKRSLVFIMCALLVMLMNNGNQDTTWDEHLRVPRAMEGGRRWEVRTIDKAIKPENVLTWVNVSSTTHVFSAYLDQRQERRWQVVIIGIQLREGARPDKCDLIYPGNKQKRRPVRLISEHMPDDHLQEFAPFMYYCLLGRRRKVLPVSVVLYHTQTPQVRPLTVQLMKRKREFNFTVCTPTMFNYTGIHQLVDFIETNRLFGADHFIMYHTNSSDLVKRYLSYYIAMDTLEIIPWKVPDVMDNKVHYLGQMASMNDCLYRTMGRSKYMVFIDIDEALVPRRASSWSEVLAQVARRNQELEEEEEEQEYEAALESEAGKQNEEEEARTQKSKTQQRQQVGAFLFRNRYYYKCKAEPEPETAAAAGAEAAMATSIYKAASVLHVPSQLGIFTTGKVYEPQVRSKLIVQPEGVLLLGIHLVWKYRAGYGEHVVEPRLALLQHYRRRRDLANCTSLLPDPYMGKFAARVLPRIAHVHGKICM